MSDKTPEEIIDEVIHFLNNEREIYGDFSLSGSSIKNKVREPEEKEVKQDTQNNSDNSSVQDPALQEENHSNPVQTSRPMKDFKAQEGLFNEDESREVYYQLDKCNTLAELEELCQKADVLRTDLEDTNLVFGVGNPNADLMLVGEAPGAEEDKQGEPFVGAAGQLLNKILDAINFKREDVYIANILKHRPPNNRNPLPEERKRSLPFLLRQIDLIDPKLILCLGKVSAQTLLNNDDSLRNMRGKFHSFRGSYELMATYHPAALLRNPKWKRPTWDDVQLLRDRYNELGCKP